MDWTQALTIIGVFIGGFFYLMVKGDSNQKENNAKFEVMNGRFNGLENRLTSLEAETKNTNQRITDMGQKLDQRIGDLKTDMNQRLSTIESFLLPRNILPFEGHHKDEHEEPKEN